MHALSGRGFYLDLADSAREKAEGNKFVGLPRSVKTPSHRGITVIQEITQNAYDEGELSKIRVSVPWF